MELPKIGVLALQGAFSKHIQMLHRLDVTAIEVRKPEQLTACEGLIIPGGESTTILKQMEFIQLAEALQTFAKNKPIFGTCAGLILMAREVVGGSVSPLKLLDIKVERNAFGSQKESFQTVLGVRLGTVKEYPLSSIFIRAPRIRQTGAQVEVLAEYNEEPVLVRQGIHLGSTFHPELGEDPALHEYFIKIVRHKE